MKLNKILLASLVFLAPFSTAFSIDWAKFAGWTFTSVVTATGLSLWYTGLQKLDPKYDPNESALGLSKNRKLDPKVEKFAHFAGATGCLVVAGLLARYLSNK